MSRTYIFLSVLLLALVGALGGRYLFAPCDTLACIRQNNPWFAGKIDPQVPMFITPQNADGLLQYVQNPDVRHAVEIMLARLDDKTTAIEKKLPHTPASCAVVGNSGNLKASGYGQTIDRQDYVFRMNNAPIAGYEKDVGARITHHALHSAWGVVRNDAPNVVHIVYVISMGSDYEDAKAYQRYLASAAQGLVYVAQQLAPDVFPADQRVTIEHFPKNLADLKGGIRLVHPEFVRFINDRWFTPREQGDKQWPSTGFRTLMVALYACDRISVFGFGKPDSTTKKWEHYFPQAGKNTSGHLPAFQESVLEEMEKAGIIRRYMGTEKN